MAQLIINKQAIDKAVRAAQIKGLQRASVFLQTQLKLAVNVPNSGVSRRRKPPKRGSYRVYPNPSNPGEPPRKRTGWGQRHIMREVDTVRMVARVGVAINAIYMLYLELGTRRIRPRPWLVSTFFRVRETIAKLLAVDIK